MKNLLGIIKNGVKTMTVGKLKKDLENIPNDALVKIYYYDKSRNKFKIISNVKDKKDTYYDNKNNTLAITLYK